MDEATRRLTDLVAPLTNYERKRPDRPRWSLDGMRRLLARLGAAPSGRLVQVGGSKGKGTTAMYFESLARGAGLRAGTYLSPHLQTMLERIRLDGRDVDEGTLRGALEPILERARETGREVTFFEVMTAAAVALFAGRSVDLGVLEVGLGGRLDATTAVPVHASVLTGVELEHTELLGDSLECVAAEKAWILRPGRPAFVAARGAALDVVRRHADRVGAELLLMDEDFALREVRDDGSGFRGTLVDAAGQRHPFALPGASLFELPALCLAFACLRWLWPGRELPLQPVPRPELPGRCEVRPGRDGGALVLDGAHTPQSMRLLASELERRFPGRRAAVLFGSARGKRWQEGLKCLLEKVDKVLVTGPTGIPPEDPETIARWLRRRGVPAESIPDVASGLEGLLDHDGVRLVTGSFYLVGEARSRMDRLEGRR